MSTKNFKIAVPCNNVSTSTNFSTFFFQLSSFIQTNSLSNGAISYFWFGRREHKIPALQYKRHTWNPLRISLFLKACNFYLSACHQHSQFAHIFCTHKGLFWLLWMLLVPIHICHIVDIDWISFGNDEKEMIFFRVWNCLRKCLVKTESKRLVFYAIQVHRFSFTFLYSLWGRSGHM